MVKSQNQDATDMIHKDALMIRVEENGQEKGLSARGILIDKGNGAVLQDYGGKNNGHSCRWW